MECGDLSGRPSGVIDERGRNIETYGPSDHDLIEFAAQELPEPSRRWHPARHSVSERHENTVGAHDRAHRIEQRPLGALVESDPGEAGDDDVDLVNTAFAEQLWEVAGVGLHHFETGVLPG